MFAIVTLNLILKFHCDENEYYTDNVIGNDVKVVLLLMKQNEKIINIVNTFRDDRSNVVDITNRPKCELNIHKAQLGLIQF